MKFLLQTFILCMVLYVHTHAQDTVTQHVKKDIEWLDIAPTTKLTAKEFVQNKTVLPLPESHTLDLVSTHESRNEYRQYRYRQYYKGIPIIGADYIVHEKNAQVKKIRKKTAKNIQPNTQPSINESVALQTAIDYIGATRYAWEDETHEALVKKVKVDEQATFFPTANLVFFNPNTKPEADYRLAYCLDIFAISPMRRATVYIDAFNAEVLAVHDRISCADEVVSGQSSYHGEVSFTAHREDDKYIYKNNIGGGIKVHNCHNTKHYSNEDMIESDTLFPQDPVAVDVMWGSQKTYEYFRDTFGRLSFDSTDMTITSYIHYGENEDRAFWNGSWMTFGDGNGSTRLAPTSIDVVAHEFTHGLIDFSSDLLNYGESGALNESFSDIFGEIIEALHTPDGSNWIFGEDYVAEPGRRGSRNFANPKDPTMLNRQPDTYKGELWYTGINDNGGVHINSGVQNHWFYLLAFGGSGVNDNGYAYNIEGIGVEKAARIAYGNLISLEYNDGYAEARTNSIVVAEQLYEADPLVARQTAAAWCAVGVGDCYEDNCRSIDSLALVRLYQTTQGSSWANKWNLQTPMSDWYGVTLNDKGCVSKLEMNSNGQTGNNLNGYIPHELGNLRRLTELHLNNNLLRDTIPATIGYMESLEVLNLWGNEIEGHIPNSIGDLEQLRVINLSSNKLRSPIPETIGQLSNLTHLQINQNPLNGAVPASFGNLTALNYLDISSCRFTGRMPETLGNLTNLTGFVANDNAIVSPLPDELTNLQALQLMNLNGNKLNFAGLEAVKQMNINDLRYNPQDSTYLLRDEGEIYINAGGTISDNTYTWYKDGVLFLTVTGNNRLSLDTPGRYRCEVSNNTLTDAASTDTNFTLYSGETYIDLDNISDCRTQDSLALVDIYHATNGNNWTETWNFNEPLDWWTGVGIGSNGCVNVVDLSERNLSGKVPPEIGQLTNLKELNLSYNQLYELGSEIAAATKLTHLQLNNNKFNQNIPTEIGNLANLVYLNISHNYFRGEVPATFSNLNNLFEFRLNHNQLGGIIQPMSGLMRLYIGYNQFNFDTPEYWEQAGLEEFDYTPQDFIPTNRNGNVISVDAGGTLANNTYFWYTTNYEDIGITNVPQFTISEPGTYRCDIINDIADEIPLWSRDLEVFFVSDLPCRERDSLALVEIYEETEGANWIVTWDLSQPLNTWHGVTLSDAGCVDELDLKENDLTGTLPDAVGDMSDMTVLYMQDNAISGQIPANIGNLTNLEIIDLGNNKLSDTIPDEMSNMMRLKQLSLQRNELEGTVPEAFWEKSDLEVIRLFKNKLTGTLPHTIGALVNVEHFSIGNNNFTGAIPPEIGQMVSLKRLAIFDCNFTGTIPPEIANLSQLTDLTLHANQLIGSIPPELAQLENLVKVRLNGNELSGEIPFDINQLDELWIDGNNFTFNQIEDWVAVGASDSLDVFRYASQGEIPVYYDAGTLYVEAGGTIANNAYHWYKDGVLEETITGDNKYLPTSSDLYHCEITNSIATVADTFYTDLNLKTEPIYIEMFVWPGDFNADGKVDMSDVLYYGYAYGNEGPVRPNASPEWYEQEAFNWDYTINDINGKHQDADGNGVVDEQDLQIIKENFGRTRPTADDPPNNFESPYKLSLQTSSVTENRDEPDTLIYDVLLNSTDDSPVSLHGIDFMLEFDASNIDGISLVSAANSFLEPDELVSINSTNSNEFHIAATRTDGNNRIGRGVILQAIIIVDDISGGEPTYTLTPKNIEIMTIHTGQEGNEAQIIPVNSETLTYTPPVESPTYVYITNKATGDRFYPESDAHNAPLLKAEEGRSDDWVQWEKIYTTDGYFYLKNKATGKYFRPQNDDDAATVWQVPTSYTGVHTQWRQVPAGDDFYYLQNRANGKFIRPQNDTPDAPILQQPSTWTGDWTQWTIEPVTAPKLDGEAITFSLYPNPAEDYIRIDIQNTWGSGTVSIYDVSGKLLMQQAVTSDNQDITVENLNAGMYLLRLNTNDGRYATKRFIVK